MSEREERIEEAIRQCDELQQERELAAKRRGSEATAARASTTDPEARTMKFSDGGFAALDAITDAADNHHCTVYAPLKEEEKQIAAGHDPYARKKGDSQAVADWRARMGTAAAKALYVFRSQSAEWVNAIFRNRGLWQMPVRGQPKCRTVAVLQAIAHDIMQAVKLRAEVARNPH